MKMISAKKVKGIIFLLGFFLLLSVNLPASEVQKDKVMLDISLMKADACELSSTSGLIIKEQRDEGKEITADNTVTVSLSEENPNLQYHICLGEFSGNKNLQKVAYTLLPTYINIWQKGSFQVTEVIKAYTKEKFDAKYLAEQYLKDNGLTRSYVVSVIDNRSKVTVTTGSGKKQTLTLPIMVESEGEIVLNKDTHYSGSIYLIREDNQLNIINHVDLEEYVAGVLPSEIGSEAPFEAMKAQAVAARSETIFKLIANRHTPEHFDLCSSTHCQMYKGKFDQTEDSRKAVYDTKDEVLIYEDKIVDAVYSSCCGGISESAEKVWGGSIPYLLSRTDNDKKYYRNKSDNAIDFIENDTEYFCANNESMSSWAKRASKWERTLTKAQLERFTGIRDIERVEIIERGESGRIIKMRISGSNKVQVYNKEMAVRQAFGGLPSSLFYFKSQNPYVIVGRGAGHGVGLCQVGAINRAKDGQNYKKILKAYYTDVEISKDWKD